MESAKEFRRLPFELREIVFEHLVSQTFEWQGKLPSIIAALPPDSKLYRQDPRTFFEPNHSYVLNKVNDWDFGGMNKVLIAVIGRIIIEIR
jgi:hypothetical protein